MDDSFYNSDYLRRLLVERVYIRAKLTNPGGSLILTGAAADTERIDEYSGTIGNPFHLDLIEAEDRLAELPKDQREALLMWASGVSAKEAALLSSAKGTVFRKRRERGVKELTEKMNDGSTTRTDTRGTGRRSAPTSSRRTRRFS